MHQSGGSTNPDPQDREAAHCTRRGSLLVDSPAKRPEEQVSIAHSIVGGSAWEPTPCRSAQAYAR
jgi:hypothetical protein